MRTTMHVTTGSQDVHRESDHQQAGRTDMCGLKVPVTRPKPRPNCRPGRHGKKEQREQRQDPGEFVPGCGRLDMLDDPMIDAKQ
jgi:hypothetical protein